MSTDSFSLDDYLRQVREAESRATPHEEATAGASVSPASPRPDELFVPAQPDAPADLSTPIRPTGDASPDAPAPLPETDPANTNADAGSALEAATPPVTEPVQAAASPQPQSSFPAEPPDAASASTSTAAPVAVAEPSPPAMASTQAPLAEGLEPLPDGARPIRPTPGNWHIRDRETEAVTTRTMYPTLEAWLAENTLGFDTLVTVALAPNLAKALPDRLSNALTQAAYALGQNEPFVIRLPAASDAVLLGSDGGDGAPYGLQDLVPVVFGIYRDIRSMFIAYQARYPTRLALSSGERVEGFGEVLMWKLRDALDGAKVGMPELMQKIDVADVLAAAIESALKDIFAGLAPRDEIGRALQDPVRMSHARAAWGEFLARISGT